MKGSYLIGGTNAILDSYGEQCSFAGSDTPKHLRRKGLWPVNDFVKTRSAFTQNRCNGINFQGIPVSPPKNLTPRVLINVVEKELSGPNTADVISALGGKWRQTDLNIGMYLSPEGRESAEMVSESMMKLANSARSLKRGDFGGFLRHLNHLPRSARRESFRRFEQGDISGSFLSAHLGWEPLVKDVYNLSENIKPVESIHRISAQKKVKGTEVTFFPSSNFGFEKKVATNKKQLRLTLDVTREPSFSERFGLDNPFLIAWELVPLSFVADYFLPISSTIDALGLVGKLKGKGFSKEYSELTFQLRIPKHTMYNTFYGEFTSEELSGIYKRSVFRRAPWSPSFSDPFRSISVNVPSSLMRLSTLTALLHQRLLSLR